MRIVASFSMSSPNSLMQRVEHLDSTLSDVERVTAHGGQGNSTFSSTHLQASGL